MKSTREKLLDAAEYLILMNGYSATRVDEVIQRAGVSKGSFYHLFNSKEAMALAALDHYYSDRVARLGSGAYSGEQDDFLRAEGFLEHAERLAPELWAQGCLLAGLTVDACESSPAIAAKVRKRVDELIAILETILAPMATPTLSAHELAEQFLIAVEGAIVLARIYRDPGVLQRGLVRYRQYLISI